MAAELAAPTINGTYGAQSPYPGSEAAAHIAANAPTNGGSSGPSSTVGATPGEMGKDEIGWAFVEQYYTTLSRSPERLHVSYPWVGEVTHAVVTDTVV